MDVKVGDRLIVHGHHGAMMTFVADILEVRDSGRDRTYLIQWWDGHTSTLVPGVDTIVRHEPKKGVSARSRTRSCKK